MMKLVTTGIAGSMESGDILIEIKPGESPGVHIMLESIVENQFGKQIKQVILETIKAYDLDQVSVHAVDKGSLDYTIRARVTAAIMRGCHSQEYRW